MRHHRFSDGAGPADVVVAGAGRVHERPHAGEPPGPRGVPGPAFSAGVRYRAAGGAAGAGQPPRRHHRCVPAPSGGAGTYRTGRAGDREPAPVRPGVPAISGNGGKRGPGAGTGGRAPRGRGAGDRRYAGPARPLAMHGGGTPALPGRDLPAGGRSGLRCRPLLRPDPGPGHPTGSPAPGDPHHHRRGERGGGGPGRDGAGGGDRPPGAGRAGRDTARPPAATADLAGTPGRPGRTAGAPEAVPLE